MLASESPPHNPTAGPLPTVKMDPFFAAADRRTNLLRAENVKHHATLSKHVRRDWLRAHPIPKIPELRVGFSADLARDLAQVVSESIIDIARLVEAERPIPAERQPYVRSVLCPTSIM